MLTRGKRAALALAPAPSRIAKVRGKRNSTTPSAPVAPTDLLLAKIVHHCRPYVPEFITKIVEKHQPNAQQRPWITNSGTAKGQKKYYFVFDANTWTLKRYGTAWEAKKMAGARHAGLDAGNRIVLYYKEKRSLKSFMEGFNAQQRQTKKADKTASQHLPAWKSPKTIAQEQQRNTMRLMDDLGLPVTLGRGDTMISPLFLCVQGAIEKIKAEKF